MEDKVVSSITFGPLLDRGIMTDCPGPQEYAPKGTMAELATLRTHLEALEKWGQEVVADIEDFLVGDELGTDIPITVYPACLNRFKEHCKQARTLGLVEE